MKVIKDKIRLASSRDLPQLLDLIRPYRSPAFNWGEDVFRQEFASSQTWVMERDSEIVAFACLRDAVDAWEISVLATHSESRGKGLMEALLKSLIERYGGERHIWLEVHEKNQAAQKLYEKLGFQLDAKRGGYYSDGSAALLYSLPKKQRAP